jgi:hypothetical protein
MPNIINADNGVSSGSAGLKSSSDGTGVLALQTNGTTAVTVDASQNVGIGTALPNSKMSIAYSSTSTSVLGTYANIPLLLQNTSSTDNNWTVIGVQDASGDFSSYIGTQNTSQASSTAIMAFATNSGSGATERMRIDSSGNVGIGVTPSYRLEVKGPAATAGQLSIHDGTGDTVVSGTNAASLLFQARDTSVRTIAEIDAVNTTTNGTGGTMVFQTRGSDVLAERMRLDSNGRLQLGTTSDPGGGAMMAIKGSGTTISTVSLYIINSSSVGNFLVYDNGAINTGTTSAGSPYVNTTGNAANAVLGSDGFLRRSTSSLKYKTDIQDATHGLTDLLKLRSVTYKGKNDGDIIFGGLIAEEVDAAGLNEFVQYSADGSPDALAYGNMVSLCVKAIQEQQALITALTARITALEAQNADNPPQGETP